MNNREFVEAVSEVLAILENMDIEVVNRIPKTFMNVLIDNCSEYYKSRFDTSISLRQIRLKENTRALLGLIYLKYLISSEKKDAFLDKLRKNEIEYKKRLIKNIKLSDIFVP